MANKIKKKTARKNISKKPVKPSIVKAKKPTRRIRQAHSRPTPGKPIGAVTHFYTAIKVAIVKFKVPVKVRSKIRFKGATTDFAQTIESMQYDHKPVTVAKKSREIGIKAKKRVREGDLVYSEK